MLTITGTRTHVSNARVLRNIETKTDTFIQNQKQLKLLGDITMKECLECTANNEVEKYKGIVYLNNFCEQMTELGMGGIVEKQTIQELGRFGEP